MIVVTTPTGHVGSKLLPLLLGAGESVRVIARDPSKLPSDVRSHVEVVRGSADDASVLDAAFKGAESLFWVVPPSFGTKDVREYYLQFTRPAVDAIEKQGVKRVVSVSSLGRHLGRKAGVISASHAKDELLERSGASFRALWAPGFMENMLMQLPSLKQQGAYFAPYKADLETPHVATCDIAASAAKLLLDRSWTGTGGLEVLGPEDLSQNDMAKIMTEVLGRPIRFQPIPAAAYKDSLMSHGASESMAESLIEMHAAIDDGLYVHAPRTPETGTPTTFRRWCEAVLKPAFLA
jgi:uncharacterized protein YbjT (DUF2867 family)